MTDKEVKTFHNLPSDGTMRVATLVLSTDEGTNATLQFTDRDSGKVVMSVDTTENWVPALFEAPGSTPKCHRNKER